MSVLSYEIREEAKVAVLTMNNAEENSFSPELLHAFVETLDALEADPSVRAIVLTGAHPKFFSTGLDLKWLMANAKDPKALKGYLDTLGTVYRKMTLFPKPTVAALNGHTYAGGFFLAAHMDFRFMREDRGFVCIPEVNINIPLLPGMIAICEAAMPPQSFRRMYYTGERFGGPDAKAMGFVDEVYPEAELLDAAVAFAGKLGFAKTATYAEMKRRIRQPIADLIEHEDPKHYFATLGFAM